MLSKGNIYVYIYCNGFLAVVNVSRLLPLYIHEWVKRIVIISKWIRVIVSFILIQSVVLKYGEQLQSLNANASTFAKKSYENHNSFKACVDQLFQSTKIMEIQKVPVYTFVHLP